MTPERLAEIRAAAAEYQGGWFVQHRPGSAIAHRGELLRLVDEIGTDVTVFRGQRDSAWSTVRVHATPIARAADQALIQCPGDVPWQLVSSMARNLLLAAGPSLDLHYTITGHAVCGYGENLPAEHRHHVLRGTPIETDDITCVACRAYIEGLRAGRNQAR